VFLENLKESLETVLNKSHVKDFESEKNSILNAFNDYPLFKNKDTAYSPAQNSIHKIELFNAYRT
jgi:hypothetical protein